MQVQPEIQTNVIVILTVGHFFLLHCTRSLFNSSFVTVGTKKQALKAIHVDMTLRKRATKRGKRDREEKCIPFT